MSALVTLFKSGAKMNPLNEQLIQTIAKKSVDTLNKVLIASFNASADKVLEAKLVQWISKEDANRDQATLGSRTDKKTIMPHGRHTEDISIITRKKQGKHKKHGENSM